MYVKEFEKEKKPGVVNLVIPSIRSMNLKEKNNHQYVTSTIKTIRKPNSPFKKNL